MRLLLLVALALLAAPATAAAAAGTYTVTYPSAATISFTGTVESESATIYTQNLTGGAPGFVIYAAAGTTLAANLGATGCEANGAYVPTASLVCPRTGVTLVTADAGAGNDTFHAADTQTAPTLINGGPGGDYLIGGVNADTINGDAGDDTLIGAGGNDTIDGGDDNDTINGDAGANQLSGGPGNDTFNGGSDGETIHGDAGNDTLRGYGGADTLYGDDGTDTVYGFDGADALSGGADNDFLEGGTETDTYDGGGGDDTISYRDLAGPSTITMGAGANDGPASAGGENVNTENVVGTNGNDTITGDGGPNSIDGAGGTDQLIGGGGDDKLKTGGEDSTLDGGAGADIFDGGTYASARVTYAGRGTPVTVTFDGLANDGDPAANGGSGEKDTILLDRTRGVIGTSAGDTITGGAGDEYLDGGPGPDTLKGGAGGDTLVGGPGAATPDTIDGEAGANAVDYSARSESLSVDLGNPTTDGAGGGAEGDVITNVRSIYGGSGSDVLRAAPITGSEGGPPPPRSLIGGDGADELYGTEGVDAFDGGNGNDKVFAYGAIDRLVGGPGDDELHGGTSDDYLYGDRDKGRNPTTSEGGATDPGDGIDLLNGGDGGDTLAGGGGADALEGGEGNDTLWGGAGADAVVGGLGYDFVDFQYRAASVDVTLGAGDGDDGNAIDGPAGARDTLSADIEAINGTGAADRIAGSAVDNVFNGFYGDDELRGLGGSDTINGGYGGYGGDGADIIDGGDGNDTVTYAQGPNAVNITFDGVANDGALGTGEAASGLHDNILGMENAIGSAGADSFTGTGAPERFEGWSGADTITAAGGDDVIVGGDGADVIDAGSGDDVIGTGYYGSDQFALNSYDNARDRVEAGPGADYIAASNDPGPGVNGNTLDGGTGPDTITYQGDYRPATVHQDGVANDGIVGNGATDNVTNFETIVGTTGADTLLGGGGALVLDGFAGPDAITGSGVAEQLLGGAGDDTMKGGGGDDLLIGGDGKDAMTGEAGQDAVSYADRATTVKVTIDALANDGDPTVVGGGEKDKVDAEVIVGGDADDTLTGGAAADALRGGPGADLLAGGDGADVLDGGTGKDRLTSGSGSDRLEAVDGELDTLICDTRAGKAVLVDVALDDFTTCADPAAIGAASGEGGTPFAPLADATKVPYPGGPQAPPVVPLTVVAPRSASTLAAAVTLSKSAKIKQSSGAIAIGGAACDAKTRCTLSVTLRAGKKTMGAGIVSGIGAVKAKAWLTATGRRKLKASRRLPLTAELTITEGASRATVTRSTMITLTGSR